MTDDQSKGGDVCNDGKRVPGTLMQCGHPPDAQGGIYTYIFGQICAPYKSQLVASFFRKGIIDDRM